MGGMEGGREGPSEGGKERECDGMGWDGTGRDGKISRKERKGETKTDIVEMT